MAVMAREVWTDERLDDLAKRMDKGFDEVKVEIRDLRVEMNGQRSEVNERLDSMNERLDSMNQRFDSMNQRFDAMQRTMIIGFVTMSASTIAALIGATFVA
jgi:predicted nuclease with TOPRIM domain